MVVNPEVNEREITFRIYKDEDGVLCASSLDGEVYTFGKTMSALWKNIKDVLECYYEVPSSSITINLRIEADAKEHGNVEAAAR